MRLGVGLCLFPIEVSSADRIFVFETTSLCWTDENQWNWYETNAFRIKMRFATYFEENLGDKHNYAQESGNSRSFRCNGIFFCSSETHESLVRGDPKSQKVTNSKPQVNSVKKEIIRKIWSKKWLTKKCRNLSGKCS
jgi:hypothetical protein